MAVATVQQIFSQLPDVQIELIATATLIFLILLATIVVLARRDVDRHIDPVGQAEGVLAQAVVDGRFARMQAGDTHLRVKIYIDHANFFSNWRRHVEGGKRLDTLDWSKLPTVILSALQYLPLTSGRQIVYCGTNVYVSYNYESYYDLLIAVKDGLRPSKIPLDVEKPRIERWRQENRRLFDEFRNIIPNRFGYKVFSYARSVPTDLEDAEYQSDGVPLAREKLIDTHMCTDLMADAVANIYDVALLLSGDKDFHPPVAFLQRERRKYVGLVGFPGKLGGVLGTECKFTIDLSQIINGKRLYEAMRRPQPTPRSNLPPVRPPKKNKARWRARKDRVR